MTFLASSIDWFMGKRSSHMGPEQYVAHKGVRDGISTSGALLWATAEAQRYVASNNMVNAETNLLHRVAEQIDQYVPTATAVIELGPGTVTAFKNKTLPIIDRLKSDTCVLVDESMAFLQEIISTKHLRPQLNIQPIMDDFFETENAYHDERSLVCSFGSTISNIVNPVDHRLPQDALMDSLIKMSHAADKGWMLVGFDSDQDGDRIKAYFNKHALFQLNIFDRMAVELPIKGDFDPKAFDYIPEWIASSGQLAHVACANRDMSFRINNFDIVVSEGQKLHIKNSYKFTPEFFEKCCHLAGLEVVKAWADDSAAKIYLLKIEPRHSAFVQPLEMRIKNRLHAA